MSDTFDLHGLFGALLLAIVFFLVATALAALVRRAARRVEPHLSDVTGVAFASGLGQIFVYVGSFVLYAHLVPALRALGTALLAGVSVVSIVIGLAAQNTLGNLVAGLSLVMYRPMRLGDRVQLTTPRGLTTATIERLSLGYTTLRDENNNQVLVPNSLMMSSVVIRLSENGRPGAGPT